MQVEGERIVEASRAALWDVLHDAEGLAQVLPACRRVTGSAEGGFEAEIATAIGPVPLRIDCRIEVIDLDPGAALELRATGKNIIALGAGADLTLRFEDTDGGTRIVYAASGRMNAALKRVAGSALDDVTRRMAENLCTRLNAAAKARKAV